jgi:hypothetical protein
MLRPTVCAMAEITSVPLESEREASGAAFRNGKPEEPPRFIIVL